MDCEIIRQKSNSTNLVVKWFKISLGSYFNNNNNIPEEEMIETNFTDNFNLKLSNLSIQDEGRYICWAKNIYGETYTEFKLYHYSNLLILFYFLFTVYTNQD
jgi:hypothetical protein